MPEIAFSKRGIFHVEPIRRSRPSVRSELIRAFARHPLLCQIFEHSVFSFFGLDDFFERGEVLWLLKDVSHENTDVLTTAIVVLLQLVRGTVADRWVAEDGCRAELHITVELFVVLA